MARHALGQAAESDSVLAELIANHAEIAAYDIAQVCARRGYAQRDSGMPLVAHDRFLVALHDDPRWEPILRKVRGRD